MKSNMYLVGWELKNSKKGNPFYILHLVHNCKCYTAFANSDSVRLSGLNCDCNTEKQFYVASVTYYYEGFKLKVLSLEVLTE